MTIKNPETKEKTPPVVPAGETLNNNLLLNVNDLHVWFELRKWGFRHSGYVRAVDGITFDLNNGQTIAIVGESGCGKTSLMRTILLLNRPTKGEVVFEGNLINNLKADELKSLPIRGWVCTTGSLWCHATLHEYSSHFGRAIEDQWC